MTSARTPARDTAVGDPAPRGAAVAHPPGASSAGAATAPAAGEPAAHLARNGVRGQPPPRRALSEPSPAVRRLRVAAGCVALTALAFQQRPGLLAPDTKLDLVTNPGGFLRRALGLWEPTAAFGQLQNQSDGYLFPIGPFFWLGHSVGLPPWAVQRLWLALVLCLAFTGVVRLADLLRIGSHPTRLLAGAAFALSPAVLTVLGSVSVEALPTALAPWVLVPLVAARRTADRPRSPRRSAALSGLAVLAAGGVNAAATLAVLPLPALWLACQPAGRWRRRLAAWWAAAVVLATLWWVIPLLLLGRYSPPFLDYIETATVTTSRTSLVEVLRGTSHWVPFLTDVRGPLWPAGHALITQPALVLDTVLVTGLGLLGLLRRDLPYRRWLVLGFLCGVAAVAFGHVGPVDGVLAHEQRDLLDGLLAPLRNVHKYDVLLRLPLVLAGAHLASRAVRAVTATTRGPSDRDRSKVRAASVYAAIAAAVLGGAAPAFAGIVVPRGSFTDLPGYWKDAAAWLEAHSGNGRALLVPGSSFADYYWGRPGDEPLQPLARSPWAVRNAIPLAPPENIRMLDAVQQRLSNGQPSRGLAPYLARAGVGYVVVRNDLDYAAVQSARPLLVHQAVVGSGGFDLAATFGPVIGGGNRPGLYVDQDLDVPLPAVEVFAVRPDGSLTGDDPRLAAVPLADTVRVTGGPEALLEMADQGWLAGRPAVLAGDGDGAVPATAPLVVTDSPRRREVQFGRLDDATSVTLTADEPTRLHGPAADYLWPGAAGRLVVARFVGAKDVRASSSRAYADTYGPVLPADQPYAAIDDSSLTSWRSDPVRHAVGAWWEVDLGEARDLRLLRFRLDTQAPGPAVTAVRITIDAGSVTRSIADPAAVQNIDLPAGPTRRLRITVASVRGGDRPGSVGLRDVVIPGVRVGRTLTLPPVPESAGAPVLAFTAAAGRRDSCFRVVDRSLCAIGVGRRSEDGVGLDRTVTLPRPASYDVQVTARPRPDAALTALFAATGRGLRATASSAGVPDPAGSPQAAVDDDLGTGWVAAPGDKDPQLRLTWPRPVTVTGLQLQSDRALAASRPKAVLITSPAGNRSGTIDENGVLRFAPLQTATLTIHFRRVSIGTSIDPYDRGQNLLPVGVSEVVPLGPDADYRLPEDRSTPVRIVCGQGPVLRVGDRLVAFAGATTRGHLLALKPVTLLPCGQSRSTVDVPKGTTRMVAASNRLLDVEQLTMVPVGTPLLIGGSTGPGVSVARWDSADRSVRVAQRDAPTLLIVHENANAGWEATLDGRPLASVRVDGWQQGWVVPAGAAGTVQLRYRPDTLYRDGLLVGALAVLLLAALAVIRPRAVASPSPDAQAVGPTPVGAATPTRSAVAVALVGAVVLALVGGMVGVGIEVLLVLAVRFAVPRPWRGTAVAACVVAGFGAAGLLLTLRPWPSDHYAGASAAAQVGCLAVIAGLAVAPAVSPVRRLRRLDPESAVDGRHAPLEPQRRLLEDVPGDRGGGDPTEPGEREDGQPTPTERRVAEEGDHALQDEQMPEEDAVRDAAEPARGPAGEHPPHGAARTGAEDDGQQ